MANIFQEVIDKVGALGEVAKAKSAALKSQSEEQRVSGLLQKKLQEKSAQPSGNLFQGIIDRFKSEAPNLGVKLPESSFASSRQLQEQIREKIGKPIAEGVSTAVKATPEKIGNVFTGLFKGAGAAFKVATGESEAVTKKPEETFKQYYERLPTLGEAVTSRLERSPVGKIPYAAPVIGFLSEFLVPIPGLGEGKLLERIAKSGDEGLIKNLLKRSVKNVTDEEAGTLAKKLAPITDKKAVQQELENFTRTKTGAISKEVPEIPKNGIYPYILRSDQPTKGGAILGQFATRNEAESALADLKPKFKNAYIFTHETAAPAVDEQLIKPAALQVPKAQIEPPAASIVRESTVTEAFNSSKNQEKVGNFEIGSFGKNSFEKKVGQSDRFPISELGETQKHITNAYRASNDPGNYRKDNIAWISKMPNGETRVVYTRQNSKGAEEIINGHVITNPKFEETLKTYGAPAGNRTRILSLERSSSNPLNYKGNINIPRGGGSVKSSPEAQGPERKFGTAVKESPETTPALKQELQKRDLTYQPLRNERIVNAARARVAENPFAAENFVREGKEANADQIATAVELIRHHQNTGNFTKAADVADVAAEKLTQAGQSVQAAKLYAHLRPESILIKVQKLIRKLNQGKFRWQNDIKLSDETAKQIADLAKMMNEAIDPAMKVEFSEELQSILANIPRPSILRKISVIQTLAQLLNPKTILVRNPLGNEIFYRVERLTKYITSPIDWVRSKLTGDERVVTFHTVNQGEFWSNWMRGAKAGWKGSSPAGLQTQFDIYAPAFREKWNPLTYMEKSLGVSLRSFDFAAYKRAVNQTVGEMGWLRAYNEGARGKQLTELSQKYAGEASDEILKIADQYGRYITFQDDNALSRVLGGAKKSLNLGQEFGFGDLVLKYPRTPGALMMRGLEFAPTGFLRSAYLIAKPILRAHTKADVREIELSLARAITGSLGFTGLGYYLADKGIITGQPDPNKKVSGLERAIGGGKYQINMSALRRWVTSGFADTSIKDGDNFYTYDWAQPIAIALSLGANMNESVKSSEKQREQRGALAGVPSTIESSISGAVETLTEQPLLSGLKSLFGGESPVDSALKVVESMPSSFTPTIVNQFRQVVDPISRETWNPSLLKRSINRVKSRIPELSEELPKRRDVFGKEIPVMENPNLFNIFINPGFLSTYKPTPAAQLVLEIYNATGETKQLPKVVPKNLVFQGKRVDLTGEQVSSFQERIGKATDVIFTKLATDEKFQSAPNSKKADMLSYVLGKLYNAEKFTIITPEQRKKLIESMSPEEKKSFVKELKAAL